jgi:hypothetical protein
VAAVEAAAQDVEPAAAAAARGEGCITRHGGLQPPALYRPPAAAHPNT